MPCPLYMGLTSGNPLKVCGPKNRLGYAPSSAHLKIFCLSISAYRECPMYKLKASNWKRVSRWDRFFKKISDSFLQMGKEKKDGMSNV
jgi:hypothetical protein